MVPGEVAKALDCGPRPSPTRQQGFPSISFRVNPDHPHKLKRRVIILSPGFH